MVQRIDAVYENGLLRPLEPLQLSEHERVSVTIETPADASWLDLDAMEWARKEGDPEVSLDDVRRRLAKLDGTLSDLVITERGEY
jgi:predicted DNA-binding antitoxin AbrB/MazE fold protein